jgi:hypothetical protein
MLRYTDASIEMKGTLSPEQISVLAKALDLLVKKYGPFTVERKLAVADILVKLALEDGSISSVEQLVHQASWLMKQ